jgi:hypothetical protein
LLYFISSLLIIFMMKNFIRNSVPESVSGSTDAVTPFIDSIEIEKSAILSAPETLPEPNLREIPDSSRESDPELTKYINEDITYANIKPSQIIHARAKLNKMLSVPMSKKQLAVVKGQLSKLSEKWLFSRTVFPEDTLCSSYMVKLGDRFAVLGKEFKVPYEILMQINNIRDSRSLRAGDTIKIIKGPFHCTVNRSTFTMDLYLQDTFVRSFPVGLGKPGMETPTGRWVVKPAGKLISPTWTDPTSGKTYQAEDPDYPLGLRWIGLEGVDGDAKGRTGFAIHGTNNSDKVGGAVSQGCIRLYNDNEVLLYNLLMPGVSQVIVVE